MLLIIDAYNLLKYILKSAYVNEVDRISFINKLALYALRRKKKVMAVFDGGGYHKPDKIEHKGITLIYAGYDLTADEYIEQYIKFYGKNKEIVVISSDRKLCTIVEKLGAACLDVHLFASVLEEAAIEKKIMPIIFDKRALKSDDYQSSPELDELMQQSSSQSTFYRKDESIGEIKEDKVSKSEKKLRKLLKKLE